MKKTRTRYSIVFLLVLAAALAAVANRTAPSVSAASDNGKFALLIGINDYRHAPKLRGAVPDVAAFKTLLSDRFQFDANENVKTITDDQATAERIVAGFSWLIAKAKAYKRANPGKEATVFFLYSGHGSQVPVPAGVTKADEPDGYDESIVTVDSRDPEGKYFDIIDDDIAAFIAAVGAQTRNATYVFDSCHSGTIDRGDGTPREIPRDARQQPKTQLPPDFPRVAASGTGDPRDLVSDNMGDYVLISGSLSEELSREKTLADGKSARGALSYYLEMELANVNSQTTYRELMDRVAAEVNNENVGQHPQVSGLVNRMIFDGAVSDAPSPITVVDADDATVTITAGKMMGVDVGTLVALYDKSQTDPHGTTGKLGEGLVTEADLKRAVVAFQPQKGLTVSHEQRLAARAVLLSPLFNASALQVVLPSGTADPVVTDLRSRLSEDASAPARGLFDLYQPARMKKQSGAAVIVLKATFREAFCGGLPKPGSKADCAAVLPTPPTAADGKTPLPQTPDNEMVYYLAQNGDPLFDFYVKEKDPRASEKLRNALVKYARQKNLLALENRASALARAPRGGKPPVQVELLQVTGTSDDKGFHVKTTTPVPLPTRQSDYILKPGTYYRLRITNNSNDDLYITALNISTDGAINAMWPKVAQEKLLPGTSIETKLYVVSRPFGNEEFKVIATKEYSDYSLYGQGAVTKDVRGANNPLNQLMERAASGTTRDGSVREAPDTDSWAVISPFSIRVVK